MIKFIRLDTPNGLHRYWFRWGNNLEFYIEISNRSDVERGEQLAMELNRLFGNGDKKHAACFSARTR